MSCLTPPLFPETADYDSTTGSFLVGSFREGAGYEVARGGTSKALVHDERLRSVLGVVLDSARSRVLVADGDVGASVRSRPGEAQKRAGIGIYDRRTGVALSYTDLGALRPSANHLANGITIDDAGNAYVTDSLSPLIYRIGLDGRAEIFLENPAFAGRGINLNGIVHHPGGYLLVVKKSDGSLFRVPLANPSSFIRVQLPKPLVGADGVVLASATELAVVANESLGVLTNAVYTLVSNDDWKTATLTGEHAFGRVYPTIGLIVDETLYVMHCGLDQLMLAPEAEKAGLRNTATLEVVGKSHPLRLNEPSL
ncbi:SMP-30/gluconolactonase/LRE family protein [soil metagenome]